MVAPQPAKFDKTRLLQIIHDELEDLPMLPTVVVRIMRTANNRATSAQDLKNIISADPSFAARVLRLVNSPYYGFSGQITTITHAVVILGFDAVRNLSTSLGVSNGLKVPQSRSALDLTAFWSHSVATAYAASIIARRKNASAKILEEVFIGGLLHDIGKLFLNRFFPDQYYVTCQFARAAKISSLDAEQSLLGIGHPRVGKKVAEKWNLAAGTAAMITHHHQPASANEFMESASIVHAADYLAHKLKIGDAADDYEPTLAPEVEQWLNFLPAVWESMEQETQLKFQGASDFLSAMTGK